MERFLSTVFPCCFPTRRKPPLSERTPLLTDPSSHPPHASSSRNSLADVGDDGTITPGSVEARRLRKHNSVLPTPVYDAAVLRGIVEDFRSKLISVDSSAASGEKSGPERLLSSLPAKVTSEGRNVTPVHTVNLSITSTRSTTTPKLLDIWSPSPSSTSTSTSPPASTVKLTYSAAAKRAPSSNLPSKKKRSTKHPPPPTPLTLEQSTYQSLTNSISSNPITHDWSLADDDTS